MTGVEDPRLLIASHIKPWREANNAERINGFNGLMLSPHVDALFDERLIAFEDDGRLLVHQSLPPDVLNRWAIRADTRVETFRAEQQPFLAHHRELFAARAA